MHFITTMAIIIMNLLVCYEYVTPTLLSASKSQQRHQQLVIEDLD